MTSEDTCSKCGSPIPEDSDFCPNCSPKRKKTEAAPVILVIAVLVSSFLLLTSSVVNVAILPEAEADDADAAKEGDEKVTAVAPIQDMTIAAYEAAKAFIEEKYPGPKTFSELYQSSVERKGNAFTVTLSADDLGGESPVRYFFSVDLELVGDVWTLKEIKR